MRIKYIFTLVTAVYLGDAQGQCPAPGTTSIEVTNTNNNGVGSLRQAITCANSDPALDTITFNIPGVGPHTIKPTSSLPTITAENVVMDGSTQNGGIILDGSLSNLLAINGSHFTLLKCKIIDNTGNNGISLTIRSPNCIIGMPGKGNVFGSSELSIVSQTTGTNLTIQGNYFGCDTNFVEIPISNSAITVTASGAIIGGCNSGEANIFGKTTTGVVISGDNTQVLCNYFGTNPDETVSFVNFNAVRVDVDNATVSGNLIKNYTFANSGTTGIWCSDGANNTITDNIIRDSRRGIRITGGGPHHITNNSIFCNTIAGIQLVSGNNNMAAPVITSASPDLINGTTVANATVEVFTHDNAGCSGNPPCQGKTYIGTTTANGSGAWSLSGPFNPPLQTGDQLTATASSANHTSPFSSCATVVCTHPDKAALIELYEATNGPGWTNTWDTTSCDVCSWYGVGCNANGRVVCIDMDGVGQCQWDQNGSGNGLNGTIPDLALPELIDLNLSFNNNLTGNIPNFSGIPKLERLNLYQISVEGPIPNFSNFPNLTGMGISGTNITGPLPAFDNLPKLRALGVTNNSQLDGPIPNLSNRPMLDDVQLWGNKLNGGILNITNSPLLRGLELYSNNLTGPIPAFNLPNLQILYLDNNQLTGNLPTLTLPNLQAIRVNNNNLSGCFPPTYSAFCTKTYNFSNNPLLPWEGDFSQFCANQPQIAAPCDNVNTPGADEIYPDCSCDLSCPVYTASLSGTTTICRGNSTDISFNFSDGTPPYNVTWTGGTLTGISNGHTESVSPTVTTTYTISSATDANGCTATPIGPVTITVIDVVNLGAISGSNNVCANQSTNYSVPAVSGVTTYNWTAPPGATITAGQGTPNITVDWNGAASGDLCVEAVNDCGTGTPSCRAITVTPLPAAPDPVTGEATVCVGAAYTYTIDAVPNATSYNWTVPSNATLLSGQGSVTASIRWNSAGSGDVCVRAQNSCGNSTYNCLSVSAVAIPTVPVFLAGNFNPCETATLDYGVTPQAAFNDYQWTYSNGGNISAGQGTPNITMEWLGASDGQLCVTASSDLCNTDRTACRNVTIKPLPPAPSYISADDVLCVGDTGIYVLTPIAGATSYNWTANGGQFIENQTVSTVKIKWLDPTFTTMEVSANNSCGTGPSTFEPTVLVSEPVPPTITGALSFCVGGSTILDAGAGYSAYKWSNGPATRSITVGNAGTYTVTVTASNGCKSSASATVIVGASLSPVITGPSVFCSGSELLDAGSGYDTYSWAGPNGFTANTRQINAGATGTYTVTVSNNSGCTGTDTHTLSLAAPPVSSSVLLLPLPNAVNVSTATSIKWSVTKGCVVGYQLSLGTNPGASDLLNSAIVPDTFYQPAQALPAGQTIFVRIVPYNGAGGANGVQEFSFVTAGGICPPPGFPALSKTCSSAPLFCQGLHGYCNTLGGDNMPTPFPGCTAFQLGDPSWIAFIAGTTEISIRVTPSNCVASGGNNGMQGGIYASCIAQPIDLQCQCTTNPFILTATNFVVGQKYYMVLDGCNGSVCDYALEVLKGSTLTPLCADTLLIPGHQATQVATNTVLRWSAAPGAGCIDGYRLSIGTTPGSSDILNNQVVADTVYQPAQPFPSGDTVYVRVKPFNGFGEASGCQEFWFVTAAGISVDTLPPCIEWQKTIGALEEDGLRIAQPTTDGGYILGGYSNSGQSGDKKAVNKGAFDYWILKVNATGSIIWQQTLGGVNDDVLSDIYQTSDGGYIIGGSSGSGISGDKTGNNRGISDYWIIKTGPTGNILWQKTYGGNDEDLLSRIRPSLDGGYIVGGTSKSGISGDKNEMNRGKKDFWVLKLNNQGNIVWQKTYGGNDDDILKAIQQSSDGGYIIGGTSSSNISSEKQENSRGLSDYWVIKLDALGNQQWQKTIGGHIHDDLADLQQTTDNGYIIGGSSISDKNGEKSEDRIGNYDYWVVKLDELGKIQWQNTIGGGAGDFLTSIVLNDNGYIFGGKSNSTVSGDKTEPNRGIFDDYWLVKTNSLGKILWQKTLGGKVSDALESIRVTNDDGFMVSGQSSSDNDNDKTGKRVGANDIWILKLRKQNTLSCLPSIPLHNQTNVPTDTKITWPPALGCEDGYRLSLGTTPGGSDLLNNQVVADTAYQPAQPLPASDTVFVRVIPFNGVGEASGCGEFWFVTAGKGLHQRRVLVEEFTQASCLPCAWQNLAFNAILAANTDKVTAVKYHVSWPGCDPMNKHNPTEVADRVSFYGVTGAPNAFLNGVGVVNDCGAFIGSPVCVDSVDLTNENNKLTPVTIDISHTVAPDFSTVMVTVKVRSDDAISGNFRLRAAITEESINFATPPGDNGEKDFTDVMKKMLPDANGTVTGSFSAGEEKIFSFTWKPENFYNLGKIKAVAWLQDDDTKEVWQSNLSVPNIQGGGGNFANVQIGAQTICTSNWVPTCEIKNTGSVVITRADFEYNVNGGAWLPYQWIGQLNPSDTTQVTLPDIVFTQPGTNQVKIRLIETNTGTPLNQADGANTVLIQAMYTTKPLPVIHDFEGTIFPPDGFGLNNEGSCSVYGWTSIPQASGGYNASAKSLACEFFKIPKGKTVELYLPRMDLTSVTGAKLTFDHAKANYDAAGNDDRLVIEVSTDCGATWATVFDKQGNALATAPFVGALWLPASGDWISNEIDFTPYVGQSEVLVRLRGISDFGNNLYMDNITVMNSACTTPNISALGDTLTCTTPVGMLQGNSATPGATYSWSGPNGFSSTQQNPPVNVAGTYILTVNDPTNACSARDTVVVEAAVGVPSATIGTPNGTLLSCTVDSLRLIAPAGAGYTYAWSNGAKTAQIITKTPGTYTLTVTNTQNGCTAVNFVVVEKNTQKPDANALGGELPCKNPFVVLQGQSNTAGVSYAWTGPNGFTTNQQNPPVSVAGSYTLTVQNPQNGCTSTAVTTVTPQVFPTASVGKPNGLVLNCDLVTLSLQASGADQYNWAGPGGFTAAQAEISVNTAGIYTVTVTTSANGCSSTMTTSISQDIDKPTAAATGGLITCAQTSVAITGNSNTPNVGYTWAGPNNFATTQQNPLVTVAGTYFLTVRNTQNGCTSMASALVIADKQHPDSSITAPNGLEISCKRPALPLEGKLANGLTYKWAGPNNFSANTLQANIALAGTYTITVTNPQNGCSSTNSVSITENTQKPDVSAIGGILNCGAGATVTLQGQSNTANASYSWSGPNNFTSALQNPTVNVVGTYTLTVQNPQNGCTQSMVTSVVPSSKPPAAVSAQNGLQLNCKFNTLPLLASGGDAYIWSGGLGSNADASISNPGIYTVTVTNNLTQCSATATVNINQSISPPTVFATANGALTCTQKNATLLGNSNTAGATYAWIGPNNFASAQQNPVVGAAGVYTLTVTGPNFCTATASTELKGSPSLPQIAVTAGTITCKQPIAELIGNSDIAGSQFLWEAPGGTAFYSGAKVSVNLPGVYTLTVTSSPGCTASISVLVADSTAKPLVNAAGGALGCISKSVQLQGGSAVPGATFAWSGPNNFSNNSANPVVLLAGNYTLTVTDPANGCTNSKTIIVLPEKILNPGIQGTLAFCTGSSTSLGADTGFESYEWAHGPKTNNIAVDKPGVYVLKVTDSEGCTGTQSVSVAQWPSPNALLLSSADTVCANTEVILSAGGGTLYRFSANGQFLSDFSSKNTLQIQPTQTTVIGVLVKDANGCTDSTSLAEPSGFKTIKVNVQASPNLGAATLSAIKDCPGLPIRVLLNMPKCPDATYVINYQINGQAIKSTNVTVAAGLGVLDIGLQPAGSLVCNIVTVRTLGTSCAANYPPGNALTINVLPELKGQLDTTICFTQSLVLNGKTYNQNGTYTVALKSTAGCDSTLILNLKTVTKFELEKVVSFCENGFYLFYGDSLRTPGFYSKTRPGTQGCDTLVRLILTQDVSINSYLKRSICPGATYTVGDSIFSKKGFYQVFLTSKSGCDSVVNLTLDVHPLELSFRDSVVNACENQSVLLAPLVKGCTTCKYQWSQGGASATKFVSAIGEQTHSVTVTDANNCKLSASVQVNAQPTYDLEQEALLCPGDTIQAGTLKITKAGQYFLDLKSQFGCDSMVTLSVKPFDNQQLEARRDTLLLAPQSSTGEIRLAENDKKPSNYSIELLEKQSSIHGKATLSNKDKITYTLNSASFSGIDSLRYVLCPELGCPEACDSAWLVVLVQAGSLEEAMKTMPNFISPELEDGKNDQFDPIRHLVLRGIIVQSSELLILNRWGEVIHRSEDGRWDGRVNGQLVPPATYYYRLILQTGEERVVKGPIGVLR